MCQSSGVPQEGFIGLSSQKNCFEGVEKEVHITTIVFFLVCVLANTSLSKKQHAKASLIKQNGNFVIFLQVMMGVVFAWANEVLFFSGKNLYQKL